MSHQDRLDLPDRPASHAHPPGIACPKCGTSIELTETLAAPLVAEARRNFEAQAAEIREKAARFQRELAERDIALKDAELGFERRVEAASDVRLQAERQRIAEEEARKAAAASADALRDKDVTLAELEERLKSQRDQLDEAHKARIALMRREQELEDEKRKIELTVQERLAAELDGARTKAREEAEQALTLKVSEKERQIASMSLEIDNLKRKASQGSMQTQGEALEVALEDQLRSTFPSDSFDAVAKGQRGADLIQAVRGAGGSTAARILWEMKSAKNWNEGWLAKLRDDQRSDGIEVAVLVSATLPKDIDTFALHDGVWVTAPRFARPLAHVLRQSLLEISASKAFQVGQASKEADVYAYFTGPRFRQRIEAIRERFDSLRTNIEKEKQFMQRSWAAREMQIDKVVESLIGMHGDIEGIAGQVIEGLEGLDIPLLKDETP